MSKQLKCPFCKDVLELYGQSNIHGCLRCGFTVNMHTKFASITDRAPEYLKESYKFLQEFSNTDPKFVLSPVELFKPGFKASECSFYGSKEKITTGIDADKKKFGNVPRKYDFHLIAGKRMLTETMLPYFQNAIANNAENNPLVTTEPISPERHLYLMMLLESVQPFQFTSNIYSVTNMYFSTSLEEIIQRYWNIFYTGLCEPTTKERAMYSYILCEPEVNISWGVGYNKLEQRIKEFVLACLNDIDKIDINNIPMNYAPTPETCLLDEMAVESIRVYNVKAMPSTALNNQGDCIYAFDILNHTIQHNPFEGYNDKLTTQTAFKILSIYRTLGVMWNMYAVSSKDLGIECKEKYIYERTGNQNFRLLDADQFLVKFWQLVYEEIKNK